MPAPKGNLFALGAGGGRPPKYENNQQILDKINEYFSYCAGQLKEGLSVDGEGRIFDEKDYVRTPINTTITGMALFLGIVRQTLYEWERGNDKELSYIIKMAMLAVENGYEGRLSDGSNPTGSIFALKNMGWSDKCENVNTNVNAGPVEELTFEQLYQLKYGQKPD